MTCSEVLTVVVERFVAS